MKKNFAGLLSLVFLSWFSSVNVFAGTLTFQGRGSLSGFVVDVVPQLVAPTQAPGRGDLFLNEFKAVYPNIILTGNSFQQVVDSYSGTWVNHSTGKSGSFKTIGMTYDNRPILLFEWGGDCPGKYMMAGTTNDSGLQVGLDFIFGWDCVNHVEGGNTVLDFTGKK